MAANCDIVTPVISVGRTALSETCVAQKTCTKINFRGYEISIAMEGNYSPEKAETAVLYRTEICVFGKLNGKEQNLTELFIRKDEHYMNNSEDLFRLMQRIAAFTE